MLLLPPPAPTRWRAVRKRAPGDDCRWQQTGPTDEGQPRNRYQVWYRGLHAVVNTNDPQAFCNDQGPKPEVTTAAQGLARAAPAAQNETLTNYVNQIEGNGSVEHFNFYGALARLNQLRAQGTE